MSAPSSPIRVSAPRHAPSSPSERMRQKIFETYEYFLNEVDPIVGACITYMLLEQPADAIGAMISYLKLYKGNKGQVNLDNLHIRGHPTGEMKTYLTSKLGPILVSLAGKVAMQQPQQLIDFMMEELARMKDQPVESVPVSN